MDPIKQRALPALGFWAKHVEAMDWIHENYYEEEGSPPYPPSLEQLFASKEALDASLEVIRDAIAEQKEFLTELKLAVFRQIARSSVVRTKTARINGADWDFAVGFLSKSGKRTLTGALCAYLHTDGDPASLRLSTTLWVPSAKRRERALAEMLSTLTETTVQVTRARFSDWGYGSVLLSSHVLSDYWIGETSALEGARLMSDALTTLSRIDDRAWGALVVDYSV